MTMIHTSTGRTMSDRQFQKKIQKFIAAGNKFILCSDIRPEIGEIQMFAGLPFKAVRYVTSEEAHAHYDKPLYTHLFGSRADDDGQFYFEVEVAD